MTPAYSAILVQIDVTISRSTHSDNDKVVGSVNQNEFIIEKWIIFIVKQDLDKDKN